MNLVDLVLDVYEEALGNLKNRDAELELETATKLKDPERKLRRRERDAALAEWRGKSFDRRSEATHSMILLLHDLGSQ